jgi:predicted DNA-binding transcriptional regulator AlpA
VNDYSHTEITKGERRLIRLRSIIKPHGILPIGKSTFYAGIKIGRYPKATKLGKSSAWWLDEIMMIAESGVE